MKKLSITREIDAPAAVLWRLLTDPKEWARWGPTVRSADLRGEMLEEGATGTVTIPLGVTIGFEITDYIEGSSWAWKVAGVPATHHTLESLGADRCRIGFGVPWVAAPYLAVCEIALQRLETLAMNAAHDLQVQQ